MQEFIDIFSGLRRRYGFCNVQNGKTDPATGKKYFDKGDYGWSKVELKDEDYIEHLNGTRSIGIQPCDDNDEAVFGAIDIDPRNYSTFSPQKYLEIIDKKQLPLIPVKSKSGGLHLYVFAKEKVKASDIREFLEDMLFILGLPPSTEVYPKQTTLKSEGADGNKSVGSFINLPYFAKNDRVAMFTNGEEMNFDTFMKVVKLNSKTKKELHEIKNGKISDALVGESDEFKDGPPCLSVICGQLEQGTYSDPDDGGAHNKLPDGRDEFLYNIMVWAKKRFTDKWEEIVKKKAEELIVYDVSWDTKKIDEKIRLWKKETASYKCHGKPVSSFCNKNVCLKRKYGIGGQVRADWPEIVSITKWEYRPEPAFELDVKTPSGKLKKVFAKNIEHIIEQKRIKALLAAHVGILPPSMKNVPFTQMINSLLSTAQSEWPEKETQPIGILFNEIKNWINGAEAENSTTFEQGSVLKEDGRAWFTWSHFYEELKRTHQWGTKSDKTLEDVKRHFKAEYKQKRYPKAEGQKESNKPVWAVSVDLDTFEEDQAPDEIIEYNPSGEDIA